LPKERLIFIGKNKHDPRQPHLGLINTTRAPAYTIDSNVGIINVTDPLKTPGDNMLAMQTEIMAAGTITCKIYKPNNFDTLVKATNVFTDATVKGNSNHFVNVVGWGVDSSGA
jgi:hypothetical protein